jgi:RNA ligase (TIGR02306 family)
MQILSVDPIEGADRIERLQIAGWQVVSGKGNFRPGDLCVFLEIDSVPPDTETFDFLWQPSPKVDEYGTTIPQPKVSRPANFKLRSKRLRGTLSQGLALPLSILPDSVTPTEGLDVTEILGIVKWELPVKDNARELAGLFPTHIFPKTEEVRLQSVPRVLDELRKTECYVAVKMDGQSLTFARYMDGDTDVCGVYMRNYAVRDLPDSAHWQMARKLQIFEQIPTGYAVQGEFCGPKIQKNRLGLKQNSFYAFQVYSIKDRAYLDFPDFIKFCEKYNIPTVPIEYIGLLDCSLDEMLRKADGRYPSGHPREGIVVRPTKEMLSPIISAYVGGAAQRASYKVISNEFLLKIGE